MKREFTKLKKTYTTLGPIYSYIEKYIEKNIREKSINELNIINGNRILEIGFGTGCALIEFAKKTGDTGEVIGIDLTPKMHQIAKNRIKKNNLKNIKLILGDALKISFKKNYFDIAYISETLELLEKKDRKKILNKIKKSLKNNGKIGILCVSNEKSKIISIYKKFEKYYPYFSSEPFDVISELKIQKFKIINIKKMKIAGIFPMIFVVAQK